MGATESRDDSDIGHLNEETNTTPVQNRRLLTLQDPRSPTDAVHRTPIVTDASNVLDFEDPRSPSAMICRTPVEDDPDPRSPTGGIPRTPANPFIFPDPRSPSVGITRTPLMKQDEEDTKFPETTVQNSGGNLRQRRVGSGDSDIEQTNNNADSICKDSTTTTSGQEDDELRNESTLDTPHIEMELAKMGLDGQSSTPEAEGESTAKEVQGESQCTTLVVEESKLKHRGASAKKSLQAKFQNPDHSGGSSRSPLSARSALQNSPTVRGNSALSVGTKHNTRVTRPTRLVGRYQTASLDKENL